MPRTMGILAAMAVLLGAATASADIVGKSVTYDVGGKAYEGYYVRNTSLGDDQPVAVIVHDWDGLDGYEKRRARMLAEQGYAAFALDLYGKGVRPTSVAENKELSGALYKDRAEMRARLNGALDHLASLEGAGDRVVALGYCFGGAAVLELARSGRALDGFVSFHGSFGTPEGQDYKSVAGPVLILHGSNDSVAPMTDVAELTKRMDADGVTYTAEIYSGARHAFTKWDSDRYQGRADLLSWAALRDFLERTIR